MESIIWSLVLRAGGQQVYQKKGKPHGEESEMDTRFICGFTGIGLGLNQSTL